MSHSGMNKAVTEDGATYNRLRRPDDYLESLSAPPPAKRKFEAVEIEDEQDEKEPNNKRQREEMDPSWKGQVLADAEEVSREGGANSQAHSGNRAPLTRDTRRIFRPIKENGMQTMFPGLDDDSASDADDTTRDALAYLRSVRSEASTIPTLLVAPPQAPKEDERDRSMYNNGVGDHRAVYQDGMWVAVDHDAVRGYYNGDDWGYEEDIDPQEAYYKSLRHRYEALRTTLADADPKELAVLVKADVEKYVNVRLPYYKSDWRYAFDNKFPTPALVAQIDDRSLYRALEYIAEVLVTGDTISKQKSTWIWTLLALTGERGTLDYYRAGRIRELGHKAGQLSIRLRSGERRHVHRDEEEEGAEEWEVDGEGTDGEDNQEDEAVELEEAQQTALAPKTLGQRDEYGSGNGDDEDYEPPMDIGGELDGSRESKTDVPTQPTSKSSEDGNLTTSEDEGEIQEEKPQEDDEPADLEAARARLLAQLGDNLVKESIPDRKVPAHQLKAKRHRHNGKVCRDSSCRKNNQGRLEAHRKAGLRAAQGAQKKSNAANSSSKSSQFPRLPSQQQRQEIQNENPAADTHVTSLLDPQFSTSSQAVSPHDDENVGRQLPSALTATGASSEGFLSPLGPALRKAVLVEQDEAILQQLPPEIAAEARSCTDRPYEIMDESTEESEGDVEEERQAHHMSMQRDGVDGTSSHSGPASSREDAADLNTRVTIDMILTVVGECYGQRDLLRFREAW